MSHKTLFALLRPLSPFYALAMRLRAYGYHNGLFARIRLPVPVISVGNLTLGGTGKTPLVIHIAKALQGMGLRPAVLSRGYKGRARGPVNVVSDGKQVLLDAASAGDEARLLASVLPGVPVITGAKRAVTGDYAVRSLQANVLLLDDGFQHLAVERDLDLVLFRANTLLGSGWVFPGGELREPMSALGRAQAFVITDVDPQSQERVLAFREFLRQRHPRTPVFLSEYVPDAVVSLGADAVIPLDRARESSVFAACAIANPESFQQTLIAAGFSVCGFAAFADHHAFSMADVKGLVSKAKRAGACSIIVTEKDYVKLEGYAGHIGLPLWVLRMRAKVEEGFDSFAQEHMIQEGARRRAGA